MRILAINVIFQYKEYKNYFGIHLKSYLKKIMDLL